MRQRRETVEHPFGTIKARMGATHFQMRTLPKVATEMALAVLAYNLTRVMNILGVKAAHRSDAGVRGCVCPATARARSPDRSRRPVRVRRRDPTQNRLRTADIGHSGRDLARATGLRRVCTQPRPKAALSYCNMAGTATNKQQLGEVVCTNRCEIVV